MNESKDINDILRNIEISVDVVGIFRFKNSTSWIAIKDTIFNDSLIYSETGFQYKKLLSFSSIRLIFISFINIVRNPFSSNKVNTLFLGAGSGLFHMKAKVKDSYFPYQELSENQVLYMISGDDPNRLINFKDYIWSNKIIINSFSFSVLKKLLQPFLFISKKKIKAKILEIAPVLERNGLTISIDSLVNSHCKFVAGFMIYNWIFKFYKLKKAFIVSPYCYSDICAALKNNGVEVIELQHGIVGPMHRGYNYAIRSIFLPAPDKIYVYNDFWLNELITAGYFRSEDIIITGKLKYTYASQPENQIRIDERYIAFTGQNILHDKIRKFFEESDKYLLEKQTKIYYIPHPTENSEKLQLLLKETAALGSVEIKINSKYTTEQYINQSLAHISIYSSCHFDAIHFKKKTFIFDILKYNIMNYYTKVSPSIFLKIKTIEEVFKNLEHD